MVCRVCRVCRVYGVYRVYRVAVGPCAATETLPAESRPYIGTTVLDASAIGGGSFQKKWFVFMLPSMSELQKAMTQ